MLLNYIFGLLLIFLCFFFGLVVVSAFPVRHTYKVSIFTVSGTLVGCVYVKAFNRNLATKKGYRLISKYSGLRPFCLFPIVKRVSDSELK